MRESYIVAHNIGTVGTRGILMDGEGRILGSKFEAYEVDYPRPGWAEQDPSSWWAAVVKVTRRLIERAKISAKDIEALGFSSQMFGVLPVEENGNPLRPAIIWLDSRAGEQAERYVKTIDLFSLLDRGIIPPTSAKDVIPKILWVKEMEPQVFAKVHKFIDCKDYIIHKCTGRFCTDQSCASLTGFFSLKTGAWEREIVESLGLAEEKLSEVVKSTDKVGDLKAEAARELGLSERTQVVCGCGDAPAAALGSGAVLDGRAHLSIGSSAWVGIHVREPSFDVRGVGSIGSADPSRLLLIGEMENAGACLRWFRDELGGPEKEMAEIEGKSAYQIFDEIVERVEPGSRKLIFLPWMTGERCPFIDPYARGGFINLSLDHRREHMIRAIMEGVAYNIRWIIEILEEMGQRFDSLNSVGGGARSAPWLQIFADVTGKEIRQMELPGEAEPRGAGLTAGIATGIYGGFESLENMVRVERVFYPRDENKKGYDGLYGKFKEAYEGLANVYRTLNL